ncbi:MAG: site-2 protease family protein [Acaryochloridaceae cyanobacterium SU_2_1]|nr:site-2 protease family protein [Acaryochloridaceae cyanobacterium SU_2_1]
MTAVLFLVAFGILGWGFYRAQPMGQIGILAWLQSVVLMGPWLLLFGLLSLGITLNLAVTLLMIVLSISAYILLGNRLRQLGNQHSIPIPPPQASDTIPPATSTSAETPNSLDPKAEAPPTTLSMPSEDLQAVQGLFGIDTFFVTETIPYQDGAIFQGNLRGAAEIVQEQLTQSLNTLLPHQYRLFLVNNAEDKPLVIVLPTRNDPKTASGFQKLFALILALATVVSCVITGGFLQSFNLIDAPQRWREALPLGLGLVGILVAHELGHYVVARHYQVKLSWPFAFPALQIGSFGVFNRFESLLPNRQSLFDIALAGPAAGGCLALLSLFIGLGLSPVSQGIELPTQFLRESVLVGTLAQLFLGGALQSALIRVHPLVAVGWIGLVITALNLMPAGCLDGGRIVQAIYGRKIAQRTTWVTLILLAILSLANPIALYWAIIVLLLQRDLERPSLNEVTEPNDARAILGLAALLWMVTILMPLTPSLGNRLGMGSL